MTPEAPQDLRDALSSISPLSGDAESQILEMAAHRQAERGEHLLRAGDHARHAIFGRQDVLHKYYVDALGNESKRRFCANSEFSGSLADVIAPGPAITSIERQTSMEVLEVKWRRVDGMAEHHPSLMKLLRRFAELL